MKINFLLKAGTVAGIISTSVLGLSSPAQAGPSFFSGTGNYYEYISDNINWFGANNAADGLTYNGQQGYLATITSAEEQEFVYALATGQSGWIGASDADEEGVWQWVTGPEAGTQFWQGGVGGSATAPFNYANWAGGEPNNLRNNNENYAHIWGNEGGAWNDLVGRNSRFVGGYFVEYGGLEDTTPIPTPALLPGLVGMGFATLRKRRQNAKLDA